MAYAVLWYLIILLIGVGLFPISFVVFNTLNDKGYGFSKSLALLLWGIFFWWSSVLKLINNSFAGISIALIILLSISAYIYIKHSKEINAWFKANISNIFSIELVFLLAFFLFAIWKGFTPSISTTEKPMELAFINSLIHSESMPPADPWLSGYSISYYYLGYVLVALLAKFTGITGGIAFNLGLSLIFALSANNAYSILFNILSIKNPEKKKNNKLASFAAPFLLLFVSNAEGFLELLHASYLFWKQNVDGSWNSKFWQWLAIPDLNTAPISSEPSWLIRNFQTGSWWWWRASRVIQDQNYIGEAKEIIDEFPVFSFRLGDLHPHVLSIPFAILTIGFALAIYSKQNITSDSNNNKTKTKILFNYFKLSISPFELLFASVLYGSLMFINFWDLPVYLAIFCAIVVIRNVNEHGWEWKRLWEFLIHFIFVALLGYIFFLPFHLSFASQAGGIVPNLIYITRGAHFWVMFFPFLVPISLYLLINSNKSKKMLLSSAIYTTFGFLMLLLFTIILSTLIVSVLPSISDKYSQTASLFMQNMKAPNSFQDLILEGLKRRLLQPGTWLTLLGIISLSISSFFRIKNSNKQKDIHGKEKLSADIFINILLIFGALMVLAPEFVYLRDFFGYRINTIFKFYYQTWLIWSIVAAYLIAQLLSIFKDWKHWLISIILIFSTTTGIIYTAFAIADVLPEMNKSFFDNWVIDGTSSSLSSQAEEEAVNWLWSQPQKVLAEAVGDSSYSYYARISSHSGQISVLGWKGHEGQWRGSYEPQGTRAQDIQTLYETKNVDDAQAIIKKYQIEYIFIGALERNTYQVRDEKFNALADKVFESGEVMVYQVR